MVSDAIANGETQELHTFADLRPAYERVCKERGRPWEFEQIEREVLVDFELIQSVAKGDVEITKDHVFLKSKTGSAIVSWQGIDADGMISKALARSKLDKIKVTGTE